MRTNAGTQRMFDAVAARRLMVDGQVRTADVTDAALIDAMLTVPRERFLPPALAQLAYLDGDIQIAPGPRFAQADGTREAYSGSPRRARGSCSRSRLWDRLFKRGACAPCRDGCGA